MGGGLFIPASSPAPAASTPAPAPVAQAKQTDVEQTQRTMQAGLTGPRSLLTNDTEGFQRTLLS